MSNSNSGELKNRALHEVSAYLQKEPPKTLLDKNLWYSLRNYMQENAHYQYKSAHALAKLFQPKPTEAATQKLLIALEAAYGLEKPNNNVDDLLQRAFYKSVFARLPKEAVVSGGTKEYDIPKSNGLEECLLKHDKNHVLKGVAFFKKATTLPGDIISDIAEQISTELQAIRSKGADSGVIPTGGS